MVERGHEQNRGSKVKPDFPRDYVPGLGDMLPLEHPKCARYQEGLEPF